MREALPIPGPLRLGDLLDRAFRLYRVRVWLLVLTVAIFLVPLGVASGLLTGQLFTSILDISTASSTRSRVNETQLFTQLAGIYGVLGIVLVLSFFLEGVASLAVIIHGNRLLHGQPTSLGAGIRQAFGRLLPFLGLSLLRGLAILISVAAGMGVVLVPIFGLAVVAGLSGAGSGRGGAAGGVVLGLLIIMAFMFSIVLALVPTIYLTARWYTAEVGLVVERWGPLGALQHSWRLSRGQVWRSIGYVFLLGILAQIIVGLPAQAVQPMATLAFGTEGVGWALGLGTFLGYLTRIFWLPIQILAQLLLYYDLRVRQEGYDLALRVEQLEAETALATPASIVEEGER